MSALIDERWEVTPHSTSESARDAATEFLLDHVGNQLVAGQPYLMLGVLHASWIVPVQLAYPHTGVIGTVGVLAVDDETQRVIGWTPIAQMKRASRELRESREPALTEQFHSFMTASSTVT
ncbi:MAG: hypothetical protein HY741_22185 [Chloroflexi bacterium]|nr:hypothetical protein [Chloroflexota bacterium]